MPHCGIVVGPGTGARILRNLVTDSMGTLADGGGIYVSGPQGDSPDNGAVVAGNVVKDTRTPYNFGLYTDYGAAWVTVEDNVVARADSTAVLQVSPPLENVVYRNTSGTPTRWAATPYPRASPTRATRQSPTRPSWRRRQRQPKPVPGFCGHERHPSSDEAPLVPPSDPKAMNTVWRASPTGHLPRTTQTHPRFGQKSLRLTGPRLRRVRFRGCGRPEQGHEDVVDEKLPLSSNIDQVGVSIGSSRLLPGTSWGPRPGDVGRASRLRGPGRPGSAGAVITDSVPTACEDFLCSPM